MEEKDIAITEQTEESQKKKRSKEKSNIYFGQREEQAVVDYLSAEDQSEKDKIFNTILKPAFTTMIESIIRRYKLYQPNEEFKDSFDDTISFLMMKLNCFDPTTKYKAYSYCGTICKNYLIYKINSHNKQMLRNLSYDNEESSLSDTLSDNIDYSYTDSSPNAEFLNELTGTALNAIEELIASDTATNADKQVGYALKRIMDNWEDMFVCMGSNKFNRSAISLYLREETNLSQKEIKDAMKKFKDKYFEAKKKLIEG